MCWKRLDRSFFIWIFINNVWVASRSMSRLVTCHGLFRFLMKGIFGPYVLWPLDKKLIFWIVTRVSARNYTVYIYLLSCESKQYFMHLADIYKIKICCWKKNWPTGKEQFELLPYARHFNPRFVYFYPIFEVYLCTVTFGLMYG